MELERDLGKQFIKYLLEHDYPESSIATEMLIGDNYRVDIAVIDPISKLPIQIFELKSQNDPKRIEYGINQLQKYRSILGSNNLPAYLVVPKSTSPYFEVISIDKNTEKTQRSSNENSSIVLNYASQKVARNTETVNRIINEKKSAVDKFQWACWILALILAAIYMLWKLKKISIEANDIALFGAIAALVVIPFSSKLKILGVEFERESKSKQTIDNN